MWKNFIKILLLLVLFGNFVFALTKTEVSMLYVAIFNRASEGEGNRYWQNTGLSMEEVATSMLATTDAKNYFGDSLNRNRAFVEHIYLNTLNKLPSDDPEGIAYWTNLLDSGTPRGEWLLILLSCNRPRQNAGEAQDQFINR